VNELNLAQSQPSSVWGQYQNGTDV
jgi:hypothetical protein